MTSTRADILVVGAGVIGCAVAYELARRGAAVTLVDGRSVGQGATQASAGVLAPYLEAADHSDTFQSLTSTSLSLYDAFVEQVQAESGRDVPYRRTGTLEVAGTDERMDVLRQRAARIDADAHVSVLDAAATRAEEPQVAADVVGSLLIGAHGFVGVRALTAALATAARRHGVVVREQRAVHRIGSAAGGLCVETSEGTLGAAAVVLAAGSWSGTIAIEPTVASPAVRPVRGQLLHLVWKGAPLRRVLWSERCYLVPWDDGTVLAGATSEDAGFEEKATVAGVRDLLDAACDLAPQAWTATFLGTRVGLRPASPDELPIVGFSKTLPGLMYATGHYRNGVLLAPLTARLVADALVDDRRDPLLDALAPARFGL